MTDEMPIRVGVARECGDDFFAALTERVGPTVILAPLDRSPADAAVVGGWDVDDDLARALDAGVRWIQALTAGVDRVITPAVTASGVMVTNGARATARPVSEFAMARVLEHAKALRELDDRQRRRHWEPRWLGALAGSTITVVGLGPVGSRIARLAAAFEMHVIGVRRDPSRSQESCAEVLGPDGLAAALARSDFCVLAPALTPETAGIISAQVLELARPGLFLVNVGRGELIDHDALVARVRAGRMTAALDVVPDEPLPTTSPLWDVDGIAVSSHTATLTPRLPEWLADMAAENIRRFVAGEALHSVVDTTLGYPALRATGA